MPPLFVVGAGDPRDVGQVPGDRVAAVHQQVLPRDVVRVPARQEADRPRDVHRLPVDEQPRRRIEFAEALLDGLGRRWLAVRQRLRDLGTWGDNLLSAAVGRAVEPKVLAIVQERVLWHFPYLEGIQGVFHGVAKGPCGYNHACLTPGPLELI